MEMAGNNEDGYLSTELDTRETQAKEGQVGLAVVELLAAKTGTSPEELPYRLHDYVDVDALNRLVSASDSALEVSFTVEEYVVTVDENGSVHCRKH